MTNLFDFSDFYIGTVLKVDITNRRVGVYVPKLMSALSGAEETQYSVPTNNGIDGLTFSTNMNKSVTKINYIWLKSWYYKQPLPNIGSKVQVIFIDGNINNGFWKSFDPNGDYKPIPEEAHQNIFKISINGVEENICNDTKVSFQIPDYFSIIKQVDENKNIQYSLVENYKFYNNGTSLVDAINDLQKSVDFLSQERKITFNYNIDKILLTEISSTPTEKNLTRIFDHRKIDAKEKILKFGNLVDMVNYYNASYNILKTMKNTYDNYRNMLNSYIALEDKSKVPNFSESIINKNAEDIFNSLSTIDTNDSVLLQNTIKYANDIFPESCKITFNYMRKENSKPYENVTETRDIYLFQPIFTQDNKIEPMSQYLYVVCDKWSDGNNDYDLENTLATTNLNLFPKFFGFDYNGDKLYLINDVQHIDITYSYEFKYVNDIETTINPSASLDELNTLFNEWINDKSVFKTLKLTVTGDNNVVVSYVVVKEK